MWFLFLVRLAAHVSESDGRSKAECHCVIKIFFYKLAVYSKIKSWNNYAFSEEMYDLDVCWIRKDVY